MFLDFEELCEDVDIEDDESWDRCWDQVYENCPLELDDDDELDCFLPPFFAPAAGFAFAFALGAACSLLPDGLLPDLVRDSITCPG